MSNVRRSQVIQEMGKNPTAIGRTGAFMLLALLSQGGPLLLVVLSGGMALALGMVFPSLLVALYPFIFATNDSLPTFPLALGVLLTLGMWGSLSYVFAQIAQDMPRSQAFFAAIWIVGIVWFITLILVLLVGVSGPRFHIQM